MFQEQLGKALAEHMRGHIEAYLTEVAAWYPADEQTTLVVPKTIDTASQVGGVVGQLPQKLPEYAIDILSKSFAPDRENLMMYSYEGHIAGMVHSSSQISVDMIVKRHAAAVELFVKRHLYLHQLSTDEFSIIELLFRGSDFSGAEEITSTDVNRELWVAAFRIDFNISTSEDSFDQHE